MDLIRTFRRATTFDIDEFRHAAAECRAITDWLAEQRGIVVRLNSENGDSQTPAAFTQDVVRFNGVMDDGADSLIIHREGKYSSTLLATPWEKLPPDFTSSMNTHGRRYDLAVCCCLIVFARHFGERFVVESSSAADETWNDACRTCQRVLGYGTTFESRKI